MKSYKEFINESKNSIESICRKWGIDDYTINPDGSIDVDGNVYLTELELVKFPIRFGKVTDKFNCSFNELTSLEGGPKSVGRHFFCSNNKLTSLEGLPEIGGDLNCNSNNIIDFRGIPEFFRGDFNCYNNPIEEIWNLFRLSRHQHDYRCIKWINEFDVIQGNKVILDRLEEVFHQLEMAIPKNITFKNYEII